MFIAPKEWLPSSFFMAFPKNSLLGTERWALSLTRHPYCVCWIFHSFLPWIEFKSSSANMLVGVTIYLRSWQQKQPTWLLWKKQNIFSAIACAVFPVEQADKSPYISSTARQIQRASSIRTNVRPAVVRPPGRLWEWEEPRAFHTQHSARLFLLLQVSILSLTLGGSKVWRYWPFLLLLCLTIAGKESKEQSVR